MVEAAEEWLQSGGTVEVLLLIREANTTIGEFYSHLGLRAFPASACKSGSPNPE
jgi:hypothetical protein